MSRNLHIYQSLWAMRPYDLANPPFAEICARVAEAGYKGIALDFGADDVSVALSLAALLGASPGASTSVSIMIDVLKQCFPDHMKTDEWKSRIREMIPTFGESLIHDGALLHKTRDRTTRILKLEDMSAKN